MLKIAAIATLMASPLYATNCMDTKSAYQSIEQQDYQPVFSGQNETASFVVFVHQTKGWLVTVDTKDGKTCLVSSGPDWQFNALGDPV
jgi:hypothetical protein